MAKTELFSRNQPGGINTIVNESLTTGNIWFVNSATGTNGAGYGVNPDYPFASLDYAVSRVTNNNGDRIYVMTGHTETLTAAGSSLGNGGVFIGATLSNDIEIIGLGNGRKRPIFNYTTAAAASMNITAANVTLRNLVFNPVGVSAVTAAVNVTGADVWFDKCEFQLNDGTFSAVLGILTAATATRLKVTNCRFLGPATATQTCTACIQHEAGIDYVIQGCEFAGKMTQAIKNVATVLGGSIDNNRAVIATGTLFVTMAAASTPFISNNRINVPSGTTPITAAAGFVAGNIYSAAPGVVSTGETSATSTVSRL